MEPATGVVLPDFLPYLLAVFGLLVLWQYHQIQVMKGRIRAIDIFDRSDIRMYLYDGNVGSGMSIDLFRLFQSS